MLFDFPFFFFIEFLIESILAKRQPQNATVLKSKLSQVVYPGSVAKNLRISWPISCTWVSSAK
jgi:hypothetical protein